MLARELPREGVEVAHALHRHQERLIRGEPRLYQDRDLLAQVVLQLRYIDGVDRLPAAEVAPPVRDLLIEGCSRDPERASSAFLRQCRSVRRTARRREKVRSPEPSQRRVHSLPLPAVLGELGPAAGVMR